MESGKKYIRKIKEHQDVKNQREDISRKIYE